MPSFQLYVPNMVCPACAAPINLLKGFEKVKSTIPNFIDHTITIETGELGEHPDQYIKELTTALDDIGFSCEGFLEITLYEDDQTEKQHIKQIEFEKRKKIKTKKIIHNHWLKGIFGILLGAGLMALFMFGMNIPIIIMYLLSGVSTLFTLYSGKETYKNALTGVIKKQPFSMDTLFAVSTLLALAVSCAGLFIPGLPMLFDAAMLILGFKNIGKAIEESIKQKTSKKSFSSYAPRMITSEVTPKVTKIVPVKNLIPGNIIYVKAGETVPVDGNCLTKNAVIYSTIVNGRTVPQGVAENQLIYAGCVVPNDVAYIKIRVAEKESDSYLAFLDKCAKAAELRKSTIENNATKWLKYFVPAVFAIATIAFIAISFTISPVSAIYAALSILVSACPCTLGLVTPLTMKTGIIKGATYGISYKSGESIEKAASNIDTVVFDLNGTLTTGIPEVTRSTVPKEMLSIIKKMQEQSSHPFAQAIYRFSDAKESAHGDFKSISIDRSSHHAGVTATIDEIEYSLGNSNMMKDSGVDCSAYEKEIKKQDAEHAIYFTRNKIVMGYILLKDPLREDAIETVRELQKQGKHVHICTGADHLTAIKYADQLNISHENVYANCVRESKNPDVRAKTTYIKKLIGEGCKVSMVGDGGNDTIAADNSHFGIAIQSAHGDIVMQDKAGAIINSLWSVTSTFAIAKQTMANIKQNLLISLGYNLTSMLIFGGLLLAIGFTLNPVIGAALMIVQTAFVLMNIERLKRQNVVSPPVNISSCQSVSEDTLGSTSTLCRLTKEFPKKHKTHAVTQHDEQTIHYASPFVTARDKNNNRGVQETFQPKLL